MTNWLTELEEINNKGTQGEWWLSEYDGRSVVETSINDGGGVIDIEVTDVKENAGRIARFDPPTVGLMIDVVRVGERAAKGELGAGFELKQAINRLKKHLEGGE